MRRLKFHPSPLKKIKHSFVFFKNGQGSMPEKKMKKMLAFCQFCDTLET